MNHFKIVKIPEKLFRCWLDKIMKHTEGIMALPKNIELLTMNISKVTTSIQVLQLTGIMNCVIIIRLHASAAEQVPNLFRKMNLTVFLDWLVNCYNFYCHQLTKRRKVTSASAKHKGLLMWWTRLQTSMIWQGRSIHKISTSSVSETQRPVIKYFF